MKSVVLVSVFSCLFTLGACTIITKPSCSEDACKIKKESKKKCAKSACKIKKSS